MKALQVWLLCTPISGCLLLLFLLLLFFQLVLAWRALRAERTHVPAPGETPSSYSPEESSSFRSDRTVPPDAALSRVAASWLSSFVGLVRIVSGHKRRIIAIYGYPRVNSGRHDAVRPCPEGWGN
ncbi:hypothetical protein DTO282E5_8608 [Paecilomyces variotii]|nr:hypothetical protein DTO282E5_8608 [Paecilomyces variotii]